MKLIIGNKNYSSWSLRPWLLLKMHQLDFEEIVIPLYQPDSAAKIRQYNSAGKVPVLVDQTLTVWDSLAICEYISERYLAGRGWPVDAKLRATARAVCAEMHAGFTALRSVMPMNCRARDRRVEYNPVLQQDIERISQLWTELRAQHQGSGPWLFGEFSIADCMFAPVVCRFNSYNVAVSDPVKRYMQTVLNSAPMLSWFEASQQEMEVIAESEVGKY